MESDHSATCWGAIVAGGVAIAALTLVLVALGSALGFSSVSPWPNSGITASTFEISTGLYFVFTALVASTIGGYISGRLRSKWTGVHTYEVQFRDTAHGFLSWALATIVGAAALGGAATYLTGNGTIVGGANSTTDYYVAQLMRPSAPQQGAAAPTSSTPAAAATSQAPAGGQAERQARAILVHDAAKGASVTDSDRSYLAELVSIQTGSNPADAKQRVTDVLNQAKADAARARKAAASISIWLTISMLVGAFAAGLAAIEGGQLRDRRWRGVFWSRAYTEAKIEP